MTKEIKKAEELIDMMHSIPTSHVKNFVELSLRTINSTFSEIYGNNINLDSHFLVLSQTLDNKTAQDAYELYFYLKNLNKGNWRLNSQGHIIVSSWKKDIVLDKNKMRELITEVKTVRNNLLDFHSVKD